MARTQGRVLVTGGAGFIGRHLVRALLEDGVEVVCIDDFSSSDRRALMEFDEVDAFTFIEGDVSDVDVARYAVEGCGTVFHLAANPEVRVGETDPIAHVTGNIDPTVGVLEAMRQEEVQEILFTSTSTVYGNATVLPTTEEYGPLLPISIYGGAKLAAEGLVSSYCGTFGMRAALFRFANVVGPEASHGVTVDFVRKLRAEANTLEILGDGTQTKSYVHVTDTVEAVLHAWRHGMPPPGSAAPYNIGSLDWIPVTRVAEIVAEVLDVSPKHRFTGAAPGGGGWRGDVPRMHLSVERLMATGWRPHHSSEEAVRDTAKWLAGSDPAHEQ